MKKKYSKTVDPSKMIGLNALNYKGGPPTGIRGVSTKIFIGTQALDIKKSAPTGIRALNGRFRVA